MLSLMLHLLFISPALQDARSETMQISADGIVVEFVCVEGGLFELGRGVALERVIGAIVDFEAGSRVDEGPPRTVKVEPFYLSQRKITTEQFVKFLNTLPIEVASRYVAINHFSTIAQEDGGFRSVGGKENCAANTVTWRGAAAFAVWFSHKSGKPVRLPTEAEWEYAAKGPAGRSHPWGDRELRAREWHDILDSGPCLSLTQERLTATPDGLIGMASSVGEWVADEYKPSHHKDARTIRCGEEPCRVLKRLLHASPTEREPGFEATDAGIYGFRIAMSGRCAD